MTILVFFMPKIVNIGSNFVQVGLVENIIEIRFSGWAQI